MKHLVVTNAPKTTTEWRELVFKLIRLQFAGKNNEDKSRQEPVQQNSYSFMPWQPSQPFLDSGPYSQTKHSIIVFHTSLHKIDPICLTTKETYKIMLGLCIYHKLDQICITKQLC